MHTAVVVIADIVRNHLDQFLFAGETPAVVALTLEDAPKAFHRAVVNAFGHAGHTLCHSSLHQFMMKSSIRILEATV